MARVTLLGSKGGPAVYPASDRMPTASLVDMAGQRIVVDCGIGVTRSLTRTGFHLRDLSVILVTHLHSDHYLELGPLIHTAWTAGLKSPVTVHGPSGLASYWQHFLASMAHDIETRVADEGRVPLAGLVTILPLADRQTVALGDVTVTPVLNNHPPVMESFALVIEGEGRRIVLSGDTAPFPGWDLVCAGADLLVHEAMLGEGVDRLVARVGNGSRLKAHLEASHTEARAVGALADRAAVKRLALNHLVPSDDPLVTDADWEAAVRAGGYDGELVVGRDGTGISLP